MAEPTDLLRLDYAETAQVVRMLTDIRFKLIAFVPTVAGVALGLLSAQTSPAARFTVGLVGLAATVGILVYELRNTQLHEAALRRAQFLERRLGFPPTREGSVGGVYGERPSRTLRLLGVGRD